MSGIREDVKIFCDTTTIRGVSRISKSRETFLKFMWTIAFLLCASMFIFFLHSIAYKYLKWPVTTEFKESHRTSIDFPDVTICSLNKFVNSYRGNKTIKEYFKVWEDLEFNNTDEKLQYRSLIYNFAAFIRNLPKQIDFQENDCPSFVVECQLIGTNWVSFQSCESDFVREWNPNYYSCYTIRVSKLKRPKNQTIRGMLLILNNGPPSEEQIPFSNSLTLQENGVRLSIHSPGTPPDLKRGVDLSPGTDNKIKIIQTNLQRLDKPYNSIGCTQQEYLPNSTSEKYVRDQCIDYYNQLRIYQTCACVADWFSIQKSLRNASTCGNISFSTDLQIFMDEYTKIDCAYNITLDDYLNYCQPPCFEMRYDLTAASSTWPSKSTELAIYRQYFKACINNFPKVKERFSAYEYMSDLRKNGSSTTYSNYKLSDLKEIGESLLSIKLIIGQDFPFMNVEKPLYTWDVILGIVGGVLSLWLGISAMTIPEILELVYFILKRFSKLIVSKYFSNSK